MQWSNECDQVSYFLTIVAQSFGIPYNASMVTNKMALKNKSRCMCNDLICYIFRCLNLYQSTTYSRSAYTKTQSTFPKMSIWSWVTKTRVGWQRLELSMRITGESYDEINLIWKGSFTGYQLWFGRSVTYPSSVKQADNIKRIIWRLCFCVSESRYHAACVTFTSLTNP